MRAATLRRLLVFGVCALGVSSLYLMPGVTRVGSPQAQRPLDAEPAPTRTGGSGVRTVAQPVDRTTAARPTTGRTATTSVDDPASTPPTRSGGPSADPTSTTRPPRPAADDAEAPRRVEKITAARSTHERLDLEWAAASDNVAVVGYTITLNGYPVATTTSTHARVRWFNDDSTRQLVQVTAVDAAGNESETAAVVVSRPSDDPTPAPSEAPTTSAPEPTPNETAPDQIASPPSDPQPTAPASATSEAEDQS